MWELTVVFLAFVLTLCIFVYIVIKDVTHKGGFASSFVVGDKLLNNLVSPSEYVYSDTPVSQDYEPSGPIEYIGVEQFVEMIKGAPHIAALGNTGSGKTTLGEALLRMLKDECFFIIDPNWFPGKWANAKAHTTGIGDDYKPVAEALEVVWKEFSQRTGEHSTKEYPKFNVIWDEVNDCMEEIKDAGSKLRRWLRRGRHYGIRMILFPQSDRVEALGISRHGDALRNILWIYLGENAKALVHKLRNTNGMLPAEADFLMTEKYLCIMEYGGRHFCVNPDEIKRISQEPVTVKSALTFSAQEQSAADTPSASTCKLDAIDAIIKISDAGLVKSEIALLETVFDCKAGSSKDYVEARQALTHRRAGERKLQS